MGRNKPGMMLAALLLTAGITGCSGGSGGGDTTPQNKPSEKATVDTNKPVEIVFYSTNGDSEASFNERWGDALRKKFPNWTFTYIQNQKGFSLNELITAGTKFDIYFESVAVFQSGKANDLWYDMTELIKKHNIDLSRFEPATLEAMKMMAGDQMTGLPVNMMTMGLFYNKDIFDKFGVPYPKDGMTWDQVAELSKKLTRNDGDKSYLGFVESELHVVRLNPLSIPLVDPQTNQSTLEDERWRKMLQTLVLDTKQNAEVKDWILNANNGKMPGPGNFVGNQQAAMMGYLSNFMQTNSKDLEAMNWDIVSYPSFKETPGWEPRPIRPFSELPSSASIKRKPWRRSSISYPTSFRWSRPAKGT
ncbi:extracellular solute-binding protein [Paenibacillus sp. P26]|nr:extracellular solute-binding protein [Paenibacillus sp. P26]